MKIELEPNHLVLLENELAVIKQIDYAKGSATLQKNVLKPHKDGLSFSGHCIEVIAPIESLVPYKYPEKFRLSGTCILPLSEQNGYYAV